MKDILREYLLTEKKLPLAGMGVLYLQRDPARFDVGNRQFLPPQIAYNFLPEPVEHISQLVEWLSARWGVDAAEAVHRYRGFCEELAQLLSTQDQVSWKGWGQWKKDQQGVLQFVSDNDALQLMPVAATKIIRDNETHQVRVGEDSRSSVEMTQLLHQKKPSFNYEQTIIWAWLVLALLWLGWHLYNRSLTTDSLANPVRIEAVDSFKNYQEF